MVRFTGLVFALALVAGCAAKSSEKATTDRGAGATGGSPTPSPADQTPVTTESPQNEAPNTTGAIPPGGPSQGGKPLDPSANADPNSPKQQARTNGMLGATDRFDDSPLKDDKTPTTTKGKTGGKTAETKPALVGGSEAGGEAALAFDTPDEAVKTALDAQRAALTTCHKAGTGTLEIAITVDANGKVTSAKIAASSTLKDTTTRNCVLAVIKKLQLGKGAKVTAPIRITF
ncbi:MAG TPA: hypothetical protein VMZ53_07295 [Kofleriaceae bacterium]|nr:hypothetical protein [Kofleriaceae bacterium]